MLLHVNELATHAYELYIRLVIRLIYKFMFCINVVYCVSTVSKPGHNLLLSHFFHSLGSMNGKCLCCLLSVHCDSVLRSLSFYVCVCVWLSIAAGKIDQMNIIVNKRLLSSFFLSFLPFYAGSFFGLSLHCFCWVVWLFFSIRSIHVGHHGW